MYRHGYTKTDALTLGRILFSIDGIAMKGAQRVKNQIDADRINNIYGNYGYPRTHFPFADKTRLVLQGRRIKLQGEGNYAFLTSRIKECSAPFPFNHLSYSDHISPENPDPDGLPFHFPPKPKKDINNHPGTDHGDGEKSVMNQPPNSRAQNLYAQLGDRTFTASKHVTETYHKRRNSKYISSKGKVPKDLLEHFNASTGAPTDTGRSNQQKIKAKKFKASAISPDLDTFIDILNAIKIINPTWEITTLTIGDGYQSETQTDIYYSYFPVIPCRVRKRTMRSFSFMDSDKLINKRFICAQLKMDSLYLYLFECERRKNLSNNKKNNPYLNNSPVLLIFKPGFFQCIEEDFHEVIHDTIIRETWPKAEKLIEFTKDTIKHGQGLQSVDEMASRILDKIAMHLATSDHTQ